MKREIQLIWIAICVLIISCKNKDNDLCQYKLEQLTSDTVEVVITNDNNAFTDVRDKVKKSNFSSGVYSFDEKNNLRFYGFFINQNQYRYSEEYDSKGNLLKREGTPLLEYRLWERNDSVLFNVFLFALNKKYEDIEIVTNGGDTIRPNYLYKSDFYTNVKCFPFKLPNSKNINNLILYAYGTVINSCTLEKEFLSDTTSFKEVKFTSEEKR